MLSEKNITRKDIAEEAGVSVSVVSRALNNSGYVEKEKKIRIMEIANRVGYFRNPVAMALQQRKTRQLLFFCSDLTGIYYNQMYHGMAREAVKRGYHVLAIMASNDFEMVKRTMADGILFSSESMAQDYARTVGKNYRIPTVAASFDPSCIYAKPMPSVIIDNDKVVNGVIDYLMKRGHRKIGMALPFNSGYANCRFKSWKLRMSMELGDDYIHYLLDLKGEGIEEKKKSSDDLAEYFCESEEFAYFDLFAIGEKAAMAYKESKYKATAVVCFNDDMALGMVEGLRKFGVKVPEEVSIMGIDGIFIRNHYNPKLTTMSIYPERQGAKCVDVLIRMLEGEKYKYINYSSFGILEGDTVKTL